MLASSLYSLFFLSEMQQTNCSVRLCKGGEQRFRLTPRSLTVCWRSRGKLYNGIFRNNVWLITHKLNMFIRREPVTSVLMNCIHWPKWFRERGREINWHILRLLIVLWMKLAGLHLWFQNILARNVCLVPKLVKIAMLWACRSLLLKHVLIYSCTSSF